MILRLPARLRAIFLLIGLSVAFYLPLVITAHNSAAARPLTDTKTAGLDQMIVQAGIPFFYHDANSGALFIGISPITAHTLPPFLMTNP